MFKNVLTYIAQSIGVLLFVVVFGAIGHFFVLEPSEVNGRSMENTLQDQEIIIIEKLSLLFREPRRGDIISAFDEFEELLLVKRIIGLPGEQIIVRDGSVFVRTESGEEFLLEEPYVKEGTITLPREGISATYPILQENEYFLLGDNREHSTDSRRYGAVHRSQIVGLVKKLPF